jgi:exopolysaccharide biosynthesis polyprenyl glycosylphosphotransferase
VNVVKIDEDAGPVAAGARRGTDVVSPLRPTARRRGWIVTRLLLAADASGLVAAFLLAELLFGGGRSGDVGRSHEALLFFCSLPAWLVGAKLYELYDLDEERTGHTTLGDLKGVFHLVTVGTWLLFAVTWLTKLAEPNLQKLAAFWTGAIVLVCVGRALARAAARRTAAYVQNTLIVGADAIGRLVARKVQQHREYGLRVVGFVDDEPIAAAESFGVTVAGGTADLAALARKLDVERVVVAFPGGDPEGAADAVATAHALGLQVDIVPRLHDVIGPNVGVHDIEGLPLVALPSAKLFPFSRALKAAFDRAVAAVALVLLAPVLLAIAWRIRRESPGPALFRQTRLGEGMRPFTALKFRTMRVGAGDAAHRAYIARAMHGPTPVDGEELFKLDRSDAITPTGRWLRRTSLDELPQLLNVLRGDMSLVGPRPCIPYEVEHFKPAHFARFDVPAGITGLWQVTARAHATFAEALDMDVAYARNWSLGLDLRLLLATPAQVLRQRQGTA